jgi:hypothetical protein
MHCWVGGWLPTFKTINVPSSSGQMLQNTGDHTPNNTASHPRRLESSERSLWEPKISQMTDTKLNKIINLLTITPRISQAIRVHTSHSFSHNTDAGNLTQFNLMFLMRCMWSVINCSC